MFIFFIYFFYVNLQTTVLNCSLLGTPVVAPCPIPNPCWYYYIGHVCCFALLEQLSVLLPDLSDEASAILKLSTCLLIESLLFGERGRGGGGGGERVCVWNFAFLCVCVWNFALYVCVCVCVCVCLYLYESLVVYRSYDYKWVSSSLKCAWYDTSHFTDAKLHHSNSSSYTAEITSAIPQLLSLCK